MAAGPLTQLIPYLHTFTIVLLLLALMADLCLPLSEGRVRRPPPLHRLHSSRSPPATTSFLSARWNVTL